VDIDREDSNLAKGVRETVVSLWRKAVSIASVENRGFSRRSGATTGSSVAEFLPGALY